MSDRMNVPTESWRAPRRRGLMDPDMARIGLIALAVAGALALGAGGYAMLGQRTHITPVVEADSRPIRVRPDNPGGAMVAGAEEQIMGGAGHGQADAMAPAAEAPAPQALRAQIEAARHAAIAPPTPPAPAPALKAPLAAPEPAPPAAADAPDTKPAPARPAPHAPTASTPAPPAPAGPTQVQLAALDSEQAAMTEWQRLSHRMPDLLGSRRPAVLRAERDGKTIYRLRTGGFTDTASATAFCAQVRAKGGGCAVARF